ncbi:MBL fold metallo-hydrolase [Amnibacterium endophyticum]|uniref:MBL fold metallo-hydrolase n=1 Tax=Amnibacterium endophyticum TaxID=2109337 RepID=A0ABW4LAG6_9MICO
MRITKHEHAALVLEEGGRRLVVDPGGLTNPLLGLQQVDAVVITHEHADHWTADQLKRILDGSRDAVVLGPPAVARAVEGFEVRAVSPSEQVEIGPWRLRFFGGNHAIIHPTIPAVENLGVLVNDRVYYPGDSFHIPIGIEVDTLAAPAGAPWLKISEAMDFVGQISPKRAFGTHDGVLSQAGRGIAFDRLKAVTEARGGEWFALEAGDSVDI